MCKDQLPPTPTPPHTHTCPHRQPQGGRVYLVLPEAAAREYGIGAIGFYASKGLMSKVGVCACNCVCVCLCVWVCDCVCGVNAGRLQ